MQQDLPFSIGLHTLFFLFPGYTLPALCISSVCPSRLLFSCPQTRNPSALKGCLARCLRLRFTRPPVKAPVSLPPVGGNPFRRSAAVLKLHSCPRPSHTASPRIRFLIDRSRDKALIAALSCGIGWGGDGVERSKSKRYMVTGAKTYLIQRPSV